MTCCQAAAIVRVCWKWPAAQGKEITMKWLASASLLFCMSAYLPCSAQSTLSVEKFQEIESSVLKMSEFAGFSVTFFALQPPTTDPKYAGKVYCGWVTEESFEPIRRKEYRLFQYWSPSDPSDDGPVIIDRPEDQDGFGIFAVHGCYRAGYIPSRLPAGDEDFLFDILQRIAAGLSNNLGYFVQ